MCRVNVPEVSMPVPEVSMVQFVTIIFESLLMWLASNSFKYVANAKLSAPNTIRPCHFGNGAGKRSADWVRRKKAGSGFSRDIASQNR